MSNKKNRKLILAIDFDGSIVVHEFPEIGPPMDDAFNVLKHFMMCGDRLILWTCREGVHLDKAISFCKENGIEFEKHNENVIEHDYMSSRKVYADLYIDDRMIGGFPGWLRIKEEVDRMRENFSNF